MELIWALARSGRYVFFIAGGRRSRMVNAPKVQLNPIHPSHALPIERLPLAYVVLDRNNCINEWNRAVGYIFGHSKQEVMGRNCLDFLVAIPLSDHLQDVVRRIRKGDLDAHAVNENLTKDGRTIICEWSNTPSCESGGKVKNVICLGRDITASRDAQQKLESTHRRYHAVFENALDAIFLWDDSGRMSDGNPSACDLTGYGFEEFVQLHVYDLVPVSYREHVPSLLHRFPSSGAMDGTYSLLRKDGRSRVVSCRAVAHMLDGLHLGMPSDITDFRSEQTELGFQAEGLQTIIDHAPLRKLVDRALPVLAASSQVSQNAGSCEGTTDKKAAEEYLHALQAALENAGEGIARIDVNGIYVSVNPAYCIMLGGRPDSLIGKHWQNTVHSEDISTAQATYQRMLQGQRSEMEIRSTRADHSLLWQQVVMVKGFDRQGRWNGHYCFANDITERKRSEDESREFTSRLQDLSRRVLAVQEEERQHLARELHDEIGQVLSTIRLNLAGSLEGCNCTMKGRLEESVSIVDDAIHQVRNLALDLRPSMLDDIGLVATLRWSAERQSQRANFKLDFFAVSNGDRLPSGLEIACYRIAQEAVTNIGRHARAQHVTFEFHQQPDEIRIRIHDNGVGFDMAALQHQIARGASFGIRGMRERVELVGGSFEITSSLGSGTKIDVQIPFDHRQKCTWTNVASKCR